ncbi:MAG TPA: hypothetical protein VGH50_03105 [Candidatus Binatia bacterium]|jgi:hypothetical protein
MSLIAKVAEAAERESGIVAYGFDAAGFDIKEGEMAYPGPPVEFRRFGDGRSLEHADGVIIPQGIFEKIEARKSMLGPKTDVAVDPLLLERERQVFNLVRAGKWVCFLVGDIVDDVPQGMHRESINDTDLCKRILNAFSVARRHRYRIDLGSPPELKIRDAEFRLYALRYGEPTTVFDLPHFHPIERHVIVELGDYPVGFEFDAQLFFLPFRTKDKSWATARNAVRAAAQAIDRYRQSRIVEIPSWIEEIRFKSEDDLYRQVNGLLEKVNRLESQLLSWRNYKSILTAAGAPLSHKLAALLESVFDLRIEFQGDFRGGVLEDGRHHPAAAVSVQYSAEGVDTDCVREACRRRGELGFSDGFPVVLFVNSDMRLEGVVERSLAPLSREAVDYAMRHNVVIARTIDLLLLTRELESDPHRQRELMRRLISGGGTLPVHADGGAALFRRSSADEETAPAIPFRG